MRKYPGTLAFEIWSFPRLKLNLLNYPLYYKKITQKKKKKQKLKARVTKDRTI